MTDPEIILNLWYVHDDMGFIYSLRVRLYVGTGTDEEKLAHLKQYATKDYLIARAFAIPKRFHTNFASAGASDALSESTSMGVFHHSGFQMLSSPLDLFEDALKEMENELPVQTDLSIPASPLFCLTPLYGDDDGNIFPDFTGQVKH